MDTYAYSKFETDFLLQEIKNKFRNIYNDSTLLKITDPTPVEAGWYKPETEGIYINAGGLEVLKGENPLFFFDGTNWEKSKFFSTEKNIEYFGAVNSEEIDSTYAIQKTLDISFNEKFSVKIPKGTFIVTRSLYVPKGVSMKGEGKEISILKTPFRKKPSHYPVGSIDRDKAVIALANVESSKGYYSSITSNFSKTLDLVNGHNQFYLGDGLIGYYDSDRHTNSSHPLYYPDPGVGGNGKTAWNKWKSELDEIELKGRWVGTTGRENYGLGLLKSTDNPTIRHSSNPSDTTNYVRERHGCRLHCGTRYVTLQDFKIQTNTSDRGKDSGVNFNYDRTLLKGDLSGYDSSCLGIVLENIYNYEIGGDGFSVYRAVNNSIKNCISQRVAGRGFRINGVTSTHIDSCYANGCLEAGYDFKGVHYSSLTACAADSCSKAYTFYDCSSITLNGCGAEAAKALYDSAYLSNDETQYPIYPGRSFSIRYSDGITLLNCYASTTRVTQSEVEEAGTLPSSTRHIRIDNSTNIIVQNPVLKSYIRWRTTPLRDSSNVKVGNRRVWEFQNRLVDAVFETRGDNSTVFLNTNSKNSDILKGNANRTNNIDLLDPGLVPHPDGHITAGKTIKGTDGNGGWLNGAIPVNINDFEILYPIKNKNGTWDKYWNWRESLIPIRINNDTSLHPLLELENGEFGFLDVLVNTPVTWSTVSQSDMNKFSLNITRDMDKTSWIDGGDNFFSYATMNYTNPSSETDENGEVINNTNLTFIPIMGNVNARSYKSETDGMRTVYNGSEYNGNNIASSAHGFIGNKKSDNTFNPIIANYLPMDRSLIPNGDYPLEVYVDSTGYPMLKFYGTDTGIIGRADGVDNKRMLSFNATARAKITKLASDGSATLTQCVNRTNNLIDRLRAHGLIIDGD